MYSRSFRGLLGSVSRTYVVSSGMSTAVERKRSARTSDGDACDWCASALVSLKSPSAKQRHVDTVSSSSVGSVRPP